jgi:pyruvate carboxylase subunit B
MGVTYVAAVDDREYQIELGDEGAVIVDGGQIEVDLHSVDGGFHYSLLVGADSFEVFVERCDDVCFVTIGGRRHRVRIADLRVRGSGQPVRTPLEEPGETDVGSPMPGVVVAVLVEEGQEVRTGEGLAILEAMKMENEIRAPRNGVVQSVGALPGQRVAQGDLLARIITPCGEC